MKVHLYATFRAIAGASEIDWQLPAPTLGLLIHDLSRTLWQPVPALDVRRR